MSKNERLDGGLWVGLALVGIAFVLSLNPSVVLPAALLYIIGLILIIGYSKQGVFTKTACTLIPLFVWVSLYLLNIIRYGE